MRKDQLPARVYRRTSIAEFWHFCSNCAKWPTADFIEAFERPMTGLFCSRCLEAEQQGTCSYDPRSAKGGAAKARSPIYRRRSQEEMWHVSDQCANWPEADFVEDTTLPSSGLFCASCLAIERGRRYGSGTAGEGS